MHNIKILIETEKHNVWQILFMFGLNKINSDKYNSVIIINNY